MTTTKRSVIFALSALVSLAACDKKADDEKADDEKADDEKADKKADDEKAEPEPVKEEDPKPATGPGEAVGAKALLDGFAAGKDAWMGKRVTLSGQFFSTTKVKANDEESFNISIVVDKDNIEQTIGCALGTNGAGLEGLMQYTEITVNGTVGEMFDDPHLADCELLPGAAVVATGEGQGEEPPAEAAPPAE